ncbi:hypothetical protein D3C72_1428050 [compost metagenome]
MEVGHQHVAGAEAVARRDEDGGVAVEGLDHAVLGGRAFQQAKRGGADADDAAAGGADGVQGGGGLGRDLAPLGVHLVVGGVIGLDRQEGAGADVQGHGVGGDAARANGVQQSGGEVQTRRRGGDRAVIGRKDRLIV